MDRKYSIQECELYSKMWDEIVKKIKKKKYKDLTDREKTILFIDQESVKIEM